jgi:hypothetical protein
MWSAKFLLDGAPNPRCHNIPLGTDCLGPAANHDLKGVIKSAQRVGEAAQL